MFGEHVRLQIHRLARGGGVEVGPTTSPSAASVGASVAGVTLGTGVRGRSVAVAVKVGVAEATRTMAGGSVAVGDGGGVSGLTAQPANASAAPTSPQRMENSLNTRSLYWF